MTGQEYNTHATFDGPADICLLLEGSYPFVSGGVATWMHNLILSLPELRFSAVCLLANSTEPRTLKYRLPANFRIDRIVYIHDPVPFWKDRFASISKEDHSQLESFHARMAEASPELLLGILQRFRSGRYPVRELIHGRKAWNLMVEQYERHGGDDSFMDYFWTYRLTHLPMFRLLLSELPEARVYHALSTGYAGFLGALAAVQTGRPLLLTEHGIYTKERKIEIAQAEWIARNTPDRLIIQRELGTYQKCWIRMFQTLGLFAYRLSSCIITLYEGNRELEIEEGAAPEKILIIPNGIRLNNFENLKPADYPQPEQKHFVIGFVGRIVPIKDVKTFIRACHAVYREMPDIEVRIMGPTEEDPNYFDDCLELVRLLNMESVVHFTGRVNIANHFPELDVVVLTSISEAQPLAIMEANCAGIPVVASDVGACRELIEGRTPEDRALGASGVVTGVASPKETAQGILHILGNHEVRRRMAQAGRARVRTYYREEDLNDRYRILYRTYIDQDGGNAWRA